MPASEAWLSYQYLSGVLKTHLEIPIRKAELLRIFNQRPPRTARTFVASFLSLSVTPPLTRFTIHALFANSLLIINGSESMRYVVDEK